MLRDKLQADQIAALKSSDKVKLDTLRFVISQMKNREIEKKAHLSDEETIAVIRKNIKELKESIAAFQKGNRPDLVAEYQKQLDILTPYTPAEMPDSELKKRVEAVIAKHEELAKQNPKALIGVCIKELREVADPSRIASVVQSLRV